jgi:hypothetical protein
MLSMCVADVFDANVMGRVAWVKRPGVCLVGDISVFDEMVDECRSLTMIAGSLGRLYMPLWISLDRGKE